MLVPLRSSFAISTRDLRRRNTGAVHDDARPAACPCREDALMDVRLVARAKASGPCQGTTPGH